MSMKIYDGSQSDDGDTQEQRKVGIAEYDVTTNGAVLKTSGLGSCVGVALHDEAAGVAGLAHVMLPAAEEIEEETPAKFADAGTELLIDELERNGADRARIEAKIAGGSDMLDFSQGNGGIGDRNINTVRETLAEHDVSLVAEDTGGDHGRSLEFEAETGTLVVKGANRNETEL